MTGPRVILEGLAYVESARWHDGRLWAIADRTGQVLVADAPSPRAGWP